MKVLRQESELDYIELSEEFEVKVGLHQGSLLSPLLFAIVVDIKFFAICYVHLPCFTTI